MELIITQDRRCSRKKEIWEKFGSAGMSSHTILVNCKRTISVLCAQEWICTSPTRKTLSTSNSTLTIAKPKTQRIPSSPLTSGSKMRGRARMFWSIALLEFLDVQQYSSPISCRSTNGVSTIVWNWYNRRGLAASLIWAFVSSWGSFKGSWEFARNDEFDIFKIALEWVKCRPIWGSFGLLLALLTKSDQNNKWAISSILRGKKGLRGFLPSYFDF